MGSAPVTRSFVNNRSNRAKTLILHRFDRFANVPEEARVEKFERIRNVCIRILNRGDPPSASVRFAGDPPSGNIYRIRPDRKITDL